MDFLFASTPHIHFGAGRCADVPGLLRPFGGRVLLVTGSRSFDRSSYSMALLETLKSSFEVIRLRIEGEPSPSMIDEAVMEYRALMPDVVLAVGGGSAVDAGKAIAGLLPLGHSVMEFLEGVGRGKSYPGPSLPFVAVPTTAGTGGETSKNAVLSEQGEGGFKKSFRHELLVARAVVIDPELMLDCPPDITSACGMDALTQLLESYVSSGASPMTDALAVSGLAQVQRSLIPACENGGDLEARTGMAYASCLSGLTLANAGLGSVHGLAAPLGAFFPIPHGVACGTLVAKATRLNIEVLRRRDPSNRALARYARAGRILGGDEAIDDMAACELLVDVLTVWTEKLAIPLLSAYGIGEDDLPRIVAGSRGNSMKTNPIHLEDSELAALLRSRL